MHVTQRGLAALLALLAASAAIVWLATRGRDTATGTWSPMGDSIAPSGVAASTRPPRAIAEALESEPRRTAERRAPLSPPSIAVDAGGSSVGGRIVGRLVLSDGAPIAGLEVIGWQAPVDGVLPSVMALTERRSTSAVAAARTFTRADGRFELDGLDRLSPTRLGVGADSALARIVPVHGVLPRERALDVGDVRLEARRTLRGRVFDGTGAPIPSALVTVAAATRGAGAGSRDAQSCGPAVARALVVPTSPAYVLELQTDVGDAALPSVRSGADGTFAIAAPSGSGAVHLCVRAEGCVPHARLAEVSGSALDDGLDRTQPGEVEVGDIHLAPLGELRGRVLRADGRPAAGALVRAASGARFERAGLTLGHPLAAAEGVAQDGSFAARVEPRAPHWLAVRDAGCLFWHVAGPFGADDACEIVLPAPARGVLDVRTTAGEAVEHLRVAVQPCSGNGASLDALASGLGFVWALRERALAAGVSLGFTPYEASLRRRPAEYAAWDITGLPPGDYRIVVEAEGCMPAGGWIQLSQDGERRLSVRLAPASERRFSVADSCGAPVHGARLYWRATAPMIRADATAAELPPSAIPIALGSTDAAGSLTARSLGGEGSVLVLHPDHVAVEQRVATHEHEVVHVVVARLGAVAGRIEAHDSRPLVVVATPLDGHATPLAGHVEPAPVQADGRFALVGLAPGAWRLEVLPRTGSGIRPARLAASREIALASAEVSVAPDVRTEVVLGIQSVTLGGALTGYVRIGGEPAPRMAVRVQPLRPLVTERHEAEHAAPQWSVHARSVVANDAGVYRIEGLSPGEYQVSVAEEGLVHRPLWLERVQVGIGAPRTCDVELALTDARFEVHDERRRPTAGMELLLIGRRFSPDGWTNNGLVFRAQTDSTGRATFSRIPIGDYELSGREEGGALLVEATEHAVLRARRTQSLVAVRRSRSRPRRSAADRARTHGIGKR